MWHYVDRLEAGQQALGDVLQQRRRQRQRVRHHQPVSRVNAALAALRPVAGAENRHAPDTVPLREGRILVLRGAGGEVEGGKWRLFRDEVALWVPGLPESPQAVNVTVGPKSAKMSLS